MKSKRFKGFPLERGSMPAMNQRFLLLRGANEGDEGVLHVARRVKYRGEDYIRYVGYQNGWDVLPRKEYRECLWLPDPFSSPEAEGKAIEPLKDRYQKKGGKAS